MKKWIPNALTLLNLFLGCCALVALFNQDYLLAIGFISGGLIADVLDGAVARILQVNSPLGKELDSFADMVTFGVVPGLILYILIAEGFSGGGFSGQLQWSALPAFVLSAFSGLRLAKFNLDTRQSQTFLGLPTPSSTIFVVGLLLIWHFNSFELGRVVGQPILLYIVITVLSYLLICEIPMFSFKLKTVGWKGNEIRFSFLGACVLLILFLQEAAVSAIILFYLLINISLHLSGRKVS
ncbi:MAG: CDP-alcohol phosphatidyltransferase family protein [Saprospiraceae bacterium]|nr:CDP-alcohol phosphatidyltransferase family protein [Saprospiraceae bacterium]